MSEGRERRRFERIEILAQAQVTRDAEVHLLQARNASVAGIFLEGDPMQYPDFRIGTDLELVLFGGNADDIADVVARARIVRIDLPRGLQLGGFGLEITAVDDANRARFETLLNRAAAKPDSRV